LGERGKGYERRCRIAGAEEVLERYAATVFAAAYAMVKNKEDAEDIAQRCSSAM
jgi:DNA-directed RNA polymerase specialized sigma24 family protein